MSLPLLTEDSPVRLGLSHLDHLMPGHLSDAVVRAVVSELWRQVNHQSTTADSKVVPLVRQPPSVAEWVECD